MNSDQKKRIKAAQKRINQGLQLVREAAQEIAEITSQVQAPPRAEALDSPLGLAARKSA